MNTSHIPSIVADLIGDGHRPIWIAYVLSECYTREEVTRRAIGKMLGQNDTDIAKVIRHANKLIESQHTFSLERHRSCHNSFIALNAHYHTKAA